MSILLMYWISVGNVSDDFRDPEANVKSRIGRYLESAFGNYCW